MNTTTHNQEIRTNTEDNTNLNNIAAGTSQAGMGVIMTMAAFVGLWGATCFISGLIKSGGPLEMAKGFFTATMGI